MATNFNINVEELEDQKEILERVCVRNYIPNWVFMAGSLQYEVIYRF